MINYMIVKSITIIVLVVILVYLIVLNMRISEMFEDNSVITPHFSNNFVLYTSAKILDTTIYVWQLNNVDDAIRLGQYVTTSKDKPDNTIPILNTLLVGGKYPVKYIKIWENIDKTLVLWRPVAPNGYKVLSDLFTSSDEVPGLKSIMCVPENSLEKTDQKHKNILKASKTQTSAALSLWKSGNHQGFIGNDTLYDPVLISSYDLPNYLMQKTLKITLS